MSKSKKSEIIAKLLETAENNVRAAREMLLGKNSNLTPDYQDKASGSLRTSLSGDNRVIEGVFEGESMIDADGKKYPVPPNYASKSKLVAGDVLKLTITVDGSFLFKQIGPVERKKMVGTIAKDGDNYIVVAGGKNYRVLTASITYFKLDIGDQATIAVPTAENSKWATIESAIISPDA